MFQRKIYAFIIFIVFLFIIKGCLRDIINQNTPTEVSENEIILYPNSIFDREQELIEVLNQYKVPTNNTTTVVFMPPTKCSSCKLGALAILDTMHNVYILAGDTSFFKPQNHTQKLIQYDSQLVNKKGLVRLYSAIITIKQSRVTQYKALTN
jgi:hypothetical protein